ncbi:MAG: NHL repeat-containing protein [Solirubrobacteraceae bacterium]|nr:NHL repeat-containing protein [Solirubrobacteraceae bacterium]
MSLVPALAATGRPRLLAALRFRGPAVAFALLASMVAANAAPASAAPALTPSVIGEQPQGHGVFRFPQAVAVSSGGNRIYVGDQYSGVVQVFDGAGNWLMDIGSRAARDEPGRFGVIGGVAVDKSGHLYVLDAENDRVQIFDAASGTYRSSFGDGTRFDLMSGSASASAGIVASGLAVFQPSPGAPIDVYVADSGHDRIERTTVANDSLAETGSIALSPPALGLQNPQGLTLNADGSRLYVADDGSHRVVMLDPASFALLGQAGSLGQAPGSDPDGFFPYDVAVDGASPPKLYVADNLNGRAQVFDATTLQFLTNFGRIGYGAGLGNLEIVRALHSQPEAGPGVAIADTANNRIQRFDGSGAVVAAWGIAGRSYGYVSRPRAVTFTPQGGVAVADTFNHRVAVYAPDGTQVDQRGLVSPGVGFVVPGSAPGQFEVPSGVAYTADGSLWISDTTNKRVIREAPDGTVQGVTQPGAVDDPRGLVASPNGVYVASRGSDSVIEVMPDGTTSVIRGGLQDPVALAAQADGTTWVADDRRIRNLADGTTIPAPGGGLWDQPAGIAFDAAGTLYVSEQRPGTPNGARVVRGTPNGSGYDWDTLATEGTGTGEVIEPAGLAVRPDGTTLLVADSGNNRVQRLDAPGSTPPALRRLNVTIDQPGRGTVTSDLPGIACVTDCTQGYGGSRAVTLTATPKLGSAFAGWGGICAGAGKSPTCTVTMSQDSGASASFIDAAAALPVATPKPVALKATAATIKPKVLHRARTASRRLHRKARKATKATVRITLSRAATVELRVLQGRPGRKQGSTCRVQTTKNRKRARCTRFVALKGARTIKATRVAKTTLTPTWRGRALPLGNYRLSLTLLDAGGTRVGPILRAFTVVR